VNWYPSYPARRTGDEGESGSANPVVTGPACIVTALG